MKILKEVLKLMCVVLPAILLGVMIAIAALAELVELREAAAEERIRKAEATLVKNKEILDKVSGMFMVLEKEIRETQALEDSLRVVLRKK